MEILLREHDGKYYVWKETEFRKDGYYLNGERIYYSQILDAKTEGTESYVVCGYCGKMIKNDPESIEAHFAEMESKRDCFTCKALRESGVRDKKVQYAKNEYGTYSASSTYQTVLSCANSYVSIDSMTHESVQNRCSYYACRRYGMQPIKNIFQLYPHPFETQITVDMLLEKKMKTLGTYRGYIEYDMKLRGTLMACVNELGIVDRFRLKYRSYVYYLFYSKKYNKLFYASNGEYIENLPWGIPTVKWEQVKEKIAAIYQEADK